MSDERELTYMTVWKGAALFSERSGYRKVYIFYVWATTPEKARAAALRTYPKAQHVVIRKRI